MERHKKYTKQEIEVMHNCLVDNDLTVSLDSNQPSQTIFAIAVLVEMYNEENNCGCMPMKIKIITIGR